MSEYENSVKAIKEKLIQLMDKGENVVLIGENSAGKSEILWRVADELKEQKNIYLIDSVNRSFDTSKVTWSGYSAVWEERDTTLMWRRIPEVKHVLDIRLVEDRFNLVDSFGTSAQIEQLYALFEQEIKEMCFEFIEKEFEVKIKTISDIVRPQNIVLIDGQQVMLSNGYQAIVRLFLEFLYFQKISSNNHLSGGTIIVDELDKYLSPAYTAKIFPFLQETFPEFNLCVTTHSEELLRYASNYVICPMKQNESGKINYELISSEDIQSYKKIETIFSDLFFDEERAETSSNDEIDTRLRQFLNLKLNDCWSDELEEEFVELGNGNLAPHQKLLYHQIKGWEFDE